jgi:integrase
MDEAAARRLLAAFEGSDVEMLVWLALHTGARLGELLALRWADVDLRRQVVYINRTVVEHMKKVEGADRWFDFKEPKSGKGRAVDIDAESVSRLKGHKRKQSAQRLLFGIAWADHDLVFPNTWALRSVNPGEPVRPSSISRTFRHRVEKLGLPGVNFHALRHARATMLLRQGFAAHLVSRRLGHSDVAITLRVRACCPGRSGPWSTSSPRHWRWAAMPSRLHARAFRTARRRSGNPCTSLGLVPTAENAGRASCSGSVARPHSA